VYLQTLYLQNCTLQTFEFLIFHNQPNNTTQGKVDVHYVEGNHVTILDSNEIIAAINEESLKDPK